MRVPSSRPSPAWLRPPILAVEWGRLGFLVNTRILILACLGIAVLLALGAWAVTLGKYPVPIADVVRALRGTASPDVEFIVTELRLPRVLVAALVGALLAMSGAVFQGLVRNPLASPDVIGINAGASLTAVAWIVGHQPPEALPAVACIGALGSAASVYLLSWRGRLATARWVLVGVGMNALLAAGTTFLLVRADIREAGKAYLWMTGSIYGSDWGDVRLLALAIATMTPIGLVLMRALRVIQLGDAVARSVGMRVEATRLALIVLGCIMGAAAVSVAGPIPFVALIVPHLARMLAGPMTGGVFVFTGVLGALLLLAADMVGQHALPVPLPVGVLSAAVGGLYFLFLLYRHEIRL